MQKENHPAFANAAIVEADTVHFRKAKVDRSQLPSRPSPGPPLCFKILLSEGFLNVVAMLDDAFLKSDRSRFRAAMVIVVVTGHHYFLFSQRLFSRGFGDDCASASEINLNPDDRQRASALRAY
jgi:hypothetical protein